LRKEHRATVYGTFAALRLAKDAVAANDLPRAADMLAWAQGQKPDSSLQPLISLRLAQVQYAQGEYDKALATLLTQTSASPAWQAAIAELRGDVQLAQGKPDDARISYESALKAMETSGVQDRQKDIEMKKADLAKPGQTLTAGIGGHP
jgi:predicted negative regulator of RcsB-dependent stress response